MPLFLFLLPRIIMDYSSKTWAKKWAEDVTYADMPDFLRRFL